MDDRRQLGKTKYIDDDDDEDEDEGDCDYDPPSQSMQCLRKKLMSVLI